MKKNKAPSQRQLQAGELIRRALADILAREHLRDTDLRGVSVTISEVRTSPDLQHARIFAAPLGGQNTDVVIAALNRCSKFLRGKLGRELSMRSTPALRFEADTLFDQASDLQSLLSRPEIARDLKERDLKSDEEE
ncbi:MAG TPA: 30S ribosome-binding factor RbfA [Hellea balneolensis]|uniref:Ribosome-binding factor A n=1 Tax=Hellea balneolensis TaxID=287478 RepID=A0A7C3GDZ4_9PROT|nr:30S ribosome-binding factor RbfA [Hellea balneolensis]